MELETAVAQFEKMLSVTESAVASRNINTAGTDADGERMFSKKGSSKDLSIKQQIYEHLDELNDMDVAVSISGRGIEGRNKTKLKQDAINDLKATGYQVERRGFGKIVFSEKEIKGAMKYLGTDAEIAAFKALLRVLKRGIEIYGHEDHKTRGYDTVTIAAPIELNGKRANMAVVVKLETNNEYKVHRIMAPDGGKFIFDKKIDAEPTHGSVLNSQENKQNLPINSASATIIPDSSSKNNRQNSLKTADLLSPDYGKTADTSADTEAGESYIKDTGLDTYFDDISKRAWVISF